MTNKTNILASVTAIAIGAGILIAPVAQAQTGPSDAMRAPVDVMSPPSFEELDVDGSGAITADDLEALKAKRFAEIDADGDGKVTAEELTAHAEAQRAKRMADRSAAMVKRLDTDGDGVLSQEELQAGRPDRAAHADRHDGKPGKAERGDHDGKPGKNHGKPGKNDRADKGPRKDRGGNLIERADADGDGQVTPEEYDAAMEKFMQHRPGGHGQHRG